MAEIEYDNFIVLSPFSLSPAEGVEQKGKERTKGVKFNNFLSNLIMKKFPKNNDSKKGKL